MDRVRQHRKYGWELVRRWDFDLGADAREVEQAVLRWWRDDLGVSDAVPKADMPQGGSTETASLLWVDVDETIRRVELETARL
jgi:hypothetical protein